MIRIRHVPVNALQITHWQLYHFTWSRVAFSVVTGPSEKDIARMHKADPSIAQCYALGNQNEFAFKISIAGLTNVLVISKKESYIW